MDIKYSIGDWVEFIDLDGCPVIGTVWEMCDINGIHVETTTGNVYCVNKIIRKLTEVDVLKYKVCNA